MCHQIMTIPIYRVPLEKKRVGFNPADPTIQKIMRGFLAEFIDLLSKDYELNIIDFANKSVS